MDELMLEEAGRKELQALARGNTRSLTGEGTRFHVFDRVLWLATPHSLL
jgi:hypothetical protein